MCLMRRGWLKHCVHISKVIVHFLVYVWDCNCFLKAAKRMDQVLIMKMMNHPNVVHLFEVIDDPNSDNFYMVLEYVEGKWDCDGSGPLGGLGEDMTWFDVYFFMIFL